MTIAPEPALRAWLTAACDWADATLPAYDGGSVANIVPSLLRSFGGASSCLPPLSDDLLPPDLIDDARVIVLVVLDGYGATQRRRFPQRLGTPAHPVHQVELTSVFPSTTTAALTSIQTGAAPLQHGLTGYTLALPPQRRVMNMLTFKPVDGGAFDATQLDPMSFLAVPTVYARLTEVGIESVVVSHRDYARTPLTQMQSGDTPYVGHRTLGEFAALLLREATRPSDARRFVFGYWAGVDMLAHAHGPDSFVCDAERELVDAALTRWFLGPLAASGHDVAVLVTADHGLTTVPERSARTLNLLASASGGWDGSPTGERRALGLRLAASDGRDRLRAQVEGDGIVVDTVAALRAGLYGPGAVTDEMVERIGTTLLLARGNTSFPFTSIREGTEPSAGAHGSLTEDEMLVPLQVWRFGR